MVAAALHHDRVQPPTRATGGWSRSRVGSGSTRSTSATRWGQEFLDRYEARVRERPSTHARVLLRHGRVIEARHRGCAPAHRQPAEGGAGAREDGPGRVGRTPGTYDALRSVHPSGWVGAEYLVARRCRPTPAAPCSTAPSRGRSVPRRTTRLPRSSSGRPARVGSAQLQEVIDDPDLELVGGFSSTARTRSPASARLAPGWGVSPSGWLVTDDRDAILALDAGRRAARREQGLLRGEHEHRRHRRVAGVGQGRHHHDVVQPPPDVRRGGGSADRRRLCAVGCAFSRRRGAPGLHVRTARGHGDRPVEENDRPSIAGAASSSSTARVPSRTGRCSSS